MSFVALATMASHPVPGVAEFAWAEDRLVIDALAKRGVDARLVAWRAGDAAFDGASLVVVRTPWDYKEHLDEFLAWTRRIGARAPTWNAPDILRWNVTKDYLDELSEGGVPTVPGERVRRGARFDVAAALAREGELVVKPLLDAGGRNAIRVRAGEAERAQQKLDAILADGDALVQPYLRAIATEGERSLVFFRGRFSHAVRKLPAATDFRIHAIWGGTTRATAASVPDLALARAALDAVARPLLHARVDVVTANDGRSVVIELEVLEPYLFLADGPGSAERFAEAIVETLTLVER